MQREANTAEDVYWMQEALKEASCAAFLGEVPVGAILVVEGREVARAHNEVEKKGEAFAHAEFLSIQRASQKLGDWRLIGSTLYSTLEPCLLCTGAIFLSRVKRVVWGAWNKREGVWGSLIDLSSFHHPIHSVEESSGVLQEESSLLLRSFFQAKRKEKEV